MHAVVSAVERTGLSTARDGFRSVPLHQPGSGGFELLPGLSDERERPEPGINQRALGTAQLPGCPELIPRRAPPPASKLEMRQQHVPLRAHIARPSRLGQETGDTLGPWNVLCEDGDPPHGERQDPIRRPAELGHHRIHAGGVTFGVGLKRTELEGAVTGRAQLIEAGRERVELASVSVARRDAGQVIEGSEIAGVEEERPRERLPGGGHRDATEWVPVKHELAQLIPRLRVVRIGLDDRAELLLGVSRPCLAAWPAPPRGNVGRGPRAGCCGGTRARRSDATRRPKRGAPGPYTSGNRRARTRCRPRRPPERRPPPRRTDPRDRPAPPPGRP